VTLTAEDGTAVQIIRVTVEKETVVVKENNINAVANSKIDLSEFLETTENLTWVVSDESLAVVRNNNIYALEPGRVEITAYSEDEKYVHWFFVDIQPDQSSNVASILVVDIKIVGSNTIIIEFNGQLTLIADIAQLLEISLSGSDLGVLLKADNNLTIVNAEVDKASPNLLVVKTEEDLSEVSSVSLSYEGTGMRTIDGEKIEKILYTKQLEATTDVSNVANENVRVYPAQVTDNVTVVANETIESVQIISLAGSKILATDVNDSQITIDCSAFVAGSYLVAVRLDNGQVVVSQIVK